jgi:hypothetical protein
MHANCFWLVVGGEGSTPSLITLSFATILLLTFLAHVKNRLLATMLEPDHRSVQKENLMNKATYFRTFFASLFEVGLTLGASSQAVVGPLAKTNSKRKK